MFLGFIGFVLVADGLRMYSRALVRARRLAFPWHVLMWDKPPRAFAGKVRYRRAARLP